MYDTRASPNLEVAYFLLRSGPSSNRTYGDMPQLSRYRASEGKSCGERVGGGWTSNRTGSYSAGLLAIVLIWLAAKIADTHSVSYIHY